MWANTKDKADAMLVLDRNDLSKYFIIFKKDEETLSGLGNAPSLTLVFLKNKNPRDCRNTTLGDIRSNHTPLTSIKAQIL